MLYYLAVSLVTALLFKVYKITALYNFEWEGENKEFRKSDVNTYSSI